jgi:hypothetical protein
MTLLTAAEMPPGRYWRLTNETEEHRGLQYKTGLNVDPLPFSPSGTCSEGGMYFFHESQLIYASDYVRGQKWMRPVTLTPNSKVWAEKHKYKTSEFTLGERALFYLPEELYMAAVQQNGRALQYVKDQAFDLCMAAVQQDGRALRFVNNQTFDLCMAAVQQDGLALRYVDDQIPELCIAAVQQDGVALEYVKDQTFDLCMAAVQQDGLALRYVDDQTPELCIAAVQQDGLALEYVKDQNPDLVAAANINK